MFIAQSWRRYDDKLGVPRLRPVCVVVCASVSLSRQCALKLCESSWVRAFVCRPFSELLSPVSRKSHAEPAFTACCVAINSLDFTQTVFDPSCAMHAGAERPQRPRHERAKATSLCPPANAMVVAIVVYFPAPTFSVKRRRR